MDEQVRPFGITVLAGLAILSATALGLGGIVALPPVTDGNDSGLFAIGFYLLILGFMLLTLAVAYGLMTLQPWAWRLAVLAWALSFLDALWLLTRNTINTNLILAPVVLAYLASTNVREVFQRRE